MTDIEETFKTLRERDEAALVAYVTAGDPNPRATPDIVDALVEGGADIIELGIPFSDPTADGPTIQAATVRALRAGTTPQSAMRIVEEVKKRHEVPVVLLTYYNPVYKMGIENFLKSASACGVSGLVIPDLPFEEADEYKRAAETAAIDTIFLAAPSTPMERLNKILEYASGFLYTVALFGVTGTRDEVRDSTLSLIMRLLPHTRGRIPIAVGFGISTAEHVKAIVAAGADGAIVGSAFVKAVEENRENLRSAVQELKMITRTLKAATRR